VESERQPDDEGDPRLVYIFPLKLVAGQPPTPTAKQIGRIRLERQRQLRTKSLAKLKQLADAAGAQKPGYRNVAAGQYDRNEAVAEYVKRAANGFCGLCEQPAPFEAPEGPYLESHHVIHLARGGADTIANAIALCPNCHRKMHVLDRPEDQRLLFERIVSRDPS
jgi:5-methylcytosine-specific restriction enzyme A